MAEEPTLWAHLPNAVHIDRVLVSAKSNPGLWDEDLESPASAKSAKWAQAWDTAWDLMYHMHRVKPYGRTVNLLEKTNAADDALLALMAWDNCAYMLDSDPGELAILAKLGDERAILLLPACIALAEEKAQYGK